MIKIGYFADGPWAHQALGSILQHDTFEIVFLVVRYHSGDKYLAEWAQKANVPIFRVPNVNDHGFLDRLRDHAADIFVSMSFDQILRKAIIEHSRLGFINCHAGALPFYRGRNVLNWAIINGETEFGVTVHYVDEGIDTGDIILQELEPIEPTDDYGTVLVKAQSLCAKLLTSALLKIASGTATPTPQTDIHPVGTYFPRRVDGDEWVDWREPSKIILDFIRGITLPGPCARFLLDGETFGIVKANTVPECPVHRSIPGAVVARGDRGIVVKTGDTVIELESVAAISDSGAGEAFVPRFSIGSRLGAARTKS